MCALSVFENPKALIKDILKSKKSIFMFLESKNSDLFKEVFSCIPKGQEILWIKGHSVLHKSSDSNAFENIATQQDKIDDAKEDYLIIDENNSQHFFAMLQHVDRGEASVIAVFENTTLDEFIHYLEEEVEEDVENAYVLFNRSNFLHKALPFVIEGNHYMKSFKELSLTGEGTIKKEDLFLKEDNKWNWTGYYPLYYTNN